MDTSLLNILQKVLGNTYKYTVDNNIAFACPFCNTHKLKFEVDIVTGKSHCWVCNAKFGSLKTLFKKIPSITNSQIQELDIILNNTKQTKLIYKHDIFNSNSPLDNFKKSLFNADKMYINNNKAIELPSEFIPLYIKQNTISYKKAIQYLTHIRGLTIYDILKYNIGYCDTGKYKDYIIIPSYNSNGILNYFIARSFTGNKMKYKNPGNIKHSDIIIFELHINWRLPIILCEGIFDAIAIKHNAIPLLGKSISKLLKHQIILNNVTDIYILLDTDATNEIMSHAIELNNLANVNINIIKNKKNMNGKDASEMGYINIWDIINNNTDILELYDIVNYKLYNN